MPSQPIAVPRRLPVHQARYRRPVRIGTLFAAQRMERVVHLAAQAGVRYSLINPYAYADSNLVGFANILEACRDAAVTHIVYASSSSVYGGNLRLPFSEGSSVEHPVSLYAATKKANELMAHAYSHLFGLPTTVCGSLRRTDRGPAGHGAVLFTKAILEDRPIDVFGNGQMVRDFTYVDDVAEVVIRVLDRPRSRIPS